MKYKNKTVLKYLTGLFLFAVLAMPGSNVLADGQTVSGINGITVPNFDMPFSDIGLDNKGNVIIAVTAGPESISIPKEGYDSTYNGGASDIIIAIYEVETGKLLHATYVGGAGNDWCRDLAIDANGDILLTGGTDSPDFPATVKSGKKPSIQAEQVFVLKLGKDLKHLESSILLGPGEGLAVAPGQNDNVLVAGFSPAEKLPFEMEGYNTGSSGGESDVVVAKLDHEFTVRGVTFLGGKGFDLPRAIIQEKDGSIVVSGYTDSADFPVTLKSKGAAGYDGVNGDVFVTRFDGNLQTVKASMKFGGAGHDLMHSMVAAAGSGFYVTGLTSSADFPTTDNAFGRVYNGGIADFFVTHIAADLQSLIASTYAGGSSRDWAFSLALDKGASVYVAGDTVSNDFVSNKQTQTVNIPENGGRIVLLKFTGDLTKLEKISLIGDKEQARVPRLELNGADDVIIAGTAGDINKNLLSYDLFVRRIGADHWKENDDVQVLPDDNSESIPEVKKTSLGKDFTPAE